MRKSLKRWCCIALSASLVVSGCLTWPSQSNKVSAAEQQKGVVLSKNLLENPELNPNTKDNDTPHSWYGNNDAKVTSVTGEDKDGNNQYAKVTNRSKYYSAMAQNITKVIKEGKDGDIYEISVWFKLDSDATVESMNLVVGNLVTYTSIDAATGQNKKGFDRWVTKNRVVTINKDQWVQINTSIQVYELDTVKSVELVFYSSDGEQPSSFYVDGVSLVREEEETLPVSPEENLFQNPELNPEKGNGNKPSWWYGNNGAKVVTISGADKDGNDQYVEVSNRTLFYSAMGLNVNEVIKKYGDDAVYNVSTWFKLAPEATTDTMTLKIGLNTIYKDGREEHDIGFMDSGREVTANKEQWIQAKSSFKMKTVSNISNVEIVFYSGDKEVPNSFFVDGVVLNLVECPNPPVEPTAKPTEEPTAKPTVEPTTEPTVTPTIQPTAKPTVEPTAEPTVTPTIQPTAVPTTKPTVAPSTKPTKQDNPLTISKTSYTKVKGDKKFQLTGISGEGKITYKSSNKKVVTVDKNGYVAVKGYGKATITVKATGNDTYKSATKKITIKVVPKVTTVSLKTNKKKQIEVRWKKNKDATSYQIKIGTTKRFNAPRMYKVSSKKTSYIIKKLVSKKSYCIKVRIVKKVGKDIVYSAWTNVRTGKVK